MKYLQLSLKSEVLKGKEKEQTVLITKHFPQEHTVLITKHFHKLQNTSTITKHSLRWKHLHGDKTLPQIDNNSILSQITIHFHKYETPPQIRTVAQPEQLIKQLKRVECLLAWLLRL